MRQSGERQRRRTLVVRSPRAGLSPLMRSMSDKGPGRACVSGVANEHLRDVLRSGKIEASSKIQFFVAVPAS